MTRAGDPMAPIGMFDSGVGGLTVARAVLDQLPSEQLRYVGDTLHAPYGPLPLASIRRYALEVMDGLVASGVKALVVACNSASSACLDEARSRYDVPVLEVIAPAARRALAATRNGRIGVIGTIATISSGAYAAALADADVQVTSVPCPQFAEFVERGVTSGRQLLGLAESYLAPLGAADVDTVVADGCVGTDQAGGDGDVDVHVIDGIQPRPEDAAPPVHEFTATGDQDAFLRLGKRFLGPEIGPRRPVAAG